MEENKLTDFLIIILVIAVFFTALLCVDSGNWVREFLSLPIGSILLYTGLLGLGSAIIALLVILAIIKP
jgi:hypothetical protein